MGDFPSDPEGSGFLTQREHRILGEIEHELRASDALLDVAMTDGVLPLPRWLIWIGRAALVLIPLVLLLPFPWWSGVAALAAAAAAVIRLRGRRSCRAGGFRRPEPWGKSPHHR